ncbi:MAG: competence type IV pilus minor pilin ComGF [Desemzia incerta]
MKKEKYGTCKWRVLISYPLDPKGFTLIEAVAALFIFTLCLSLFSIAAKQLNAVQEMQVSDRQLEWHLFLNQFEFDLKENQLKEVKSEKVTFNQSIPKTDQVEVVSYERRLQKLLRKVGNEGYQPMLMELRTLSFQLDQTFLIIKVEFLNGETYQSQINLKGHIKEN